MTILASAAALLALTAVPNDPAPASSPDERRPWTILVYGGADNNADGPILEFLDQVRKAIDDDPGIELLLFLDRSAGFSDDATLLGEDFTGTRLYRLKRDSAERLSGGDVFPELTLGEDAELDSADADNIRRFIAWGKEVAPARRTGLMIYSHANGQDMCPDDESGRSMGIPELSEVAGESETVDFLALELCNMGGVEIAYQWRPGSGRFGADVLLAIPNAGPPLDWDRAFARIRSPGHAAADEKSVTLDPAQMDALAFGQLVIEEGLAGRKEMATAHPGELGHESAACYDLRHAEAVKKAVDALAVELWKSDGREVFLEQRGPGPIGDAINYTRGGAYVDLYDLCQRTEDCDLLPDAVRARAADARAAVDGLVVASFGMEAYEGFEPGHHGIFIVLPAADSDWKRFTWYTPLDGGGSGAGYGRWAFLRDGMVPANGEVEGWFELLDAWFDAAGSGDDAGGANGYRW